jgi:hypothetical protein
MGKVTGIHEQSPHTTIIVLQCFEFETTITFHTSLNELQSIHVMTRYTLRLEIKLLLWLIPLTLPKFNLTIISLYVVR